MRGEEGGVEVGTRRRMVETKVKVQDEYTDKMNRI